MKGKKEGKRGKRRKGKEEGKEKAKEGRRKREERRRRKKEEGRRKGRRKGKEGRKEGRKEEGRRKKEEGRKEGRRKRKKEKGKEKEEGRKRRRKEKRKERRKKHKKEGREEKRRGKGILVLAESSKLICQDAGTQLRLRVCALTVPKGHRVRGIHFVFSLYSLSHLCCSQFIFSPSCADHFYCIARLVLVAQLDSRHSGRRLVVLVQANIFGAKVYHEKHINYFSSY